MIIGQTVFAAGSYYSPWFPRQGDAATFACESIAVNGATLAITVQHKNMDTADSGATTAGTFSSITTATTTTQRVTALLELVRFKYVLTGADNTKWIHFRMLSPSWETN